MRTPSVAGHAAWWALAGCLMMSGVVLGVRGAPWAGEWGWTLDNAADTTTLTAPVVTTFAAWIAYRWHGARSIVDSSPRGWLVTVDSWLVALAAGLAAVAVSAVAAVLYSVVTGPVGGPVQVAGFLPAVLILAACAAAGALGGTLLPHLLTIAVCPFATFIAGSLGFSGIGPKLLRVNAPTAGLAGIGLRPGYLLAQSAGLLGLIGVLLVLVLLVRRSAVPLPAVIVGVGASVVLLVGGSVALMSDGERYVYTDEAATACLRPQEGPRICSLPSHVRARDEVAPQLAKLVRALRAKGFPVPTAYSEPGRRESGGSPDGTLVLSGASVDVVGGNRVLERAAESAASPSECAFWYADAPPAEEVYLARILLADWILVDAGYEVVAWTAGSQRWLARPSADATAWAMATYRALDDCAPSRLRLPAGVTAR